jgi:hypothetical protein
MSNRRRLARERLEIYLVHLLLAYRWLIIIVGFLLAAYAIAVMIASPLTGLATALPALYLLLLGNSYNIMVYTARMSAWIITFRMREDE